MTNQEKIDAYVAQHQRILELELIVERLVLDRDETMVLAKNMEGISKHWMKLYHETCDRYEALLDNREWKQVDHKTIGGVDFTVQRDD